MMSKGVARWEYRERQRDLWLEHCVYDKPNTEFYEDQISMVGTMRGRHPKDRKEAIDLMMMSGLNEITNHFAMANRVSW